ncbi:hypothetical protein HGA91_03120 [candidate division WWE3 bacterium]|nr:hypothetical protein [candidate division WWE3 bacterium]
MDRRNFDKKSERVARLMREGAPYMVLAEWDYIVLDDPHEVLVQVLDQRVPLHLVFHAMMDYFRADWDLLDWFRAGSGDLAERMEVLCGHRPFLIAPSETLYAFIGDLYLEVAHILFLDPIEVSVGGVNIEIRLKHEFYGRVTIEVTEYGVHVQYFGVNDHQLDSVWFAGRCLLEPVDLIALGLTTLAEQPDRSLYPSPRYQRPSEMIEELIRHRQRIAASTSEN